jgi:hypothetical protein
MQRSHPHREYFRKTTKTDTLIAHPMLRPDAAVGSAARGRAAVEADPSIQRRSVEEPVITWYKIAGNKVIEENEWPGRYIPIVRVVGEEIDIDGKIERKGHVRPLKDPQRMYNFMSSAQAEYIALQTKTPYVAPVEAIEGFESLWANANHENAAYLPYNSVDEEGNADRQAAARAAASGRAGVSDGDADRAARVDDGVGQYQETFGQQSNADAGVAIAARQRQGDKATYHFIDNLARAIRFTGRILIDLIPKVYDTRRVLRIVGEDGSERFRDDRSEPAASGRQRSGAAGADGPNDKPTPEQAAQLIYNPGIGRYDVTVEVGPSFETRRARSVPRAHADHGPGRGADEGCRRPVVQGR